MDNNYVWVIGAIILVFVLVIVFVSRRKKLKKVECPINIASLIEALGGKENIVDCVSTPSTVKVTLVNNEVINVNQIKTLGASGIVQGSQSITMIFGKLSKIIEENLKENL